jgi:hypothetical protein
VWNRNCSVLMQAACFFLEVPALNSCLRGKVGCNCKMVLLYVGRVLTLPRVFRCEDVSQ